MVRCITAWDTAHSTASDLVGLHGVHASAAVRPCDSTARQASNIVVRQSAMTRVAGPLARSDPLQAISELLHSRTITGGGPRFSSASCLVFFSVTVRAPLDFDAFCARLVSQRTPPPARRRPTVVSYCGEYGRTEAHPAFCGRIFNACYAAYRESVHGFIVLRRELFGSRRRERTTL